MPLYRIGEKITVNKLKGSFEIVDYDTYGTITMYQLKDTDLRVGDMIISDSDGVNRWEEKMRAETKNYRKEKRWSGSGIQKAQERYNKAWLGKLCRQRGTEDAFKEVIKIEVIGPPSFVYGSAIVYYSDNTRNSVRYMGTGKGYRPTIKDLEIQENESN